MPDLPSPQDAAEAALHAESWDTVLSYADLCAAGSEAAVRLATEAFAHGMREVRAADAVGTVARRASRLPRIALLLTAVRTTAAAWENAGQGHDLDAGLRLWLRSERAARHAGPPPRRPLALRGLRDMQTPDAELLWLADVEALPLPVVARRLGLDPATASDELAQVRELFRDRCRRGHLDAPSATECRGYARLLDAVTRSPAADTPDDLSHHLAACPDCAEAAACLRPDGAGPPAALADGVIGWGGRAYLERRRGAAEARLGAGRPADDARGDGTPDGSDGTRRGRLVRGSLLATAVLVSLLALTVSLMPFGTTEGDAAPPATDTVDGRAIAVPEPAPPTTAGPPGRPPPSVSPGPRWTGPRRARTPTRNPRAPPHRPRPPGSPSPRAPLPPPAASATTSSTSGPTDSRPPSPSPPTRPSTPGSWPGPSRTASASARCGTRATPAAAPASPPPPPRTTGPCPRTAPSPSASSPPGAAGTHRRTTSP